MTHAPSLILIGAVIAVGVLHTLVPDHWVPIALIARQSRWAPWQTARAAAIAGLGHTLSTLAIGALVWIAGAALAVRFGHLVSLLSSLALVGFGVWIAVASILEMRRGDGHHHHHAHDHDHDHGHDHNHDDDQDRIDVPRDRPNRRVALLMILGSSPMVEGIPAFFAAARFGAPLLAVMAVCFALSTIVTYVVLCTYSGAALQRMQLGPLERYGEVLSGAIIAIVGIVFLIWPFE